MAVRIPVYERTIQLDSAAHTIPRYHAADEPGKALEKVGTSMIQVAAHWKAKQDSFEKLQMHTNVAVLQDELHKIQAEELQNFNPLTDPPGTYHDRVAARSQQAINNFYANAPAGLQKEYQVYANSLQAKTSMDSAQSESAVRNKSVTDQITGIVGRLKQQVERNPDSADQAIAQARQAIKDLSPAGNLTPAQQKIQDDAALQSVLNSAVKGYQAQGRIDEGKAYVNKFVQDRKNESPVAPAVPGQTTTAPAAPAKATIDPAKYETKLTPDEEKQFQAWKAKNAPNDSGQDYDLRGAFKAGVTPDDNGHMPDTFKKPNHPTFSVQSQYAKDRPDLAGTWDGNTYVPPTPAPAPAAAPGQQGAADTQLNQSRIDQINKKPEIAAAIEKAAAATGLDPNQLKVFASIESDGDPKQVSKNGKQQGLFQLDAAEFGMNNGGKGNILSAEDNAMAAAKVLAQKKDQLTTQLGREPTASELYASHQQGMGGITAHLQNPDQPAWKSMLSTGEGQQRIKDNGQASAEAWAKRSIEGNVPKDVVDRLYGGDASKITSKEMLAIQSTRVKGGSVDDAVTAANAQPTAQPPRTVVASADGRVISETRPPAFVGGMNVGGQQPQPQPQDAQAYPGAQIAYQPGQTFGRTATANAQPFSAIVSHYTGGDTLQSALETAKGDPSRGGVPYGYHFLIDKDGTVVQGAPLDARTNHVQGWPVGGRSSRPDINNNNAIGVAFVGSGKPTQAQLDSSHRLMAGLQQKYNIPTENVVGHGEIQAGSRDANEGMDVVNRVRSGAPVPGGPVQVAGPATAGPSTPTVPLSRWEQAGQTATTTLDGGALKAAAIQQSMKTSLAGRVQADLASTRANGTGITLPPDLQKYYGTDKLSFDFISAKLGTGAALTWQENKEFNQKVYNGVAHMEEMPRDVILQRLQDIKPDPASPTYVTDQKVYNEVFKQAQKVDKSRNADPAGYVTQTDPVVAAAYQDSLKDPNNPEKTQALITARMNAQAHLNIPFALQTPITNDEAKIVARPLLDRATPNTGTAPSQVADNVVRWIGKTTVPGFAASGEGTANMPDLAHRAMETVLRSKAITNDQAALTADALVQAQHPPPGPLRPTPPKTAKDDMLFLSKDGYYVDPMSGAKTSMPYGPPPVDEDTGNPYAVSVFQPGAKFIPSDHIKTLLAANPEDTALQDTFDAHYGLGASKHFLEGGRNNQSVSPLGQPTPPNDALSAPAPDIYQREPDILGTYPPDQTTQPDQTDQTDQGP